MDEMPLKDLIRDLKDCLVLYKNSPAYVVNIDAKSNLHLRMLASQTTLVVPFDLANFNQPLRRMGYVNIDLQTAYVERIPVRKFFLGLSRFNVQIAITPSKTLLRENVRPFETHDFLKTKEICNTFSGIYPSFKEAVAQVRAFGGACAFDRQFACSDRGAIFYKGCKVGVFPLSRGSTVASISWDAPYTYLLGLIKK